MSGNATNQELSCDFCNCWGFGGKDLDNILTDEQEMLHRVHRISR